MEALFYLIIEIFIIGAIIVSLHSVKKYFGIGLLFVYIGTVQFFQTILASNVYNLFLDQFVFSSGSTVIYTSTLFVILLIFYSDSVIKTKSIVYGLLFSNIVVTLLSYISLEQLFIDDYSRNKIFIKQLFDFDINMFIVGTSLLYFDALILISLFYFLYKRKSYSFFIATLIATSITSLFDSILFYTLNFYSEINYLELLIGNVFGKMITCVILSIVFFIYVKLSNLQYRDKKNIRRIFILFNDKY